MTKGRVVIVSILCVLVAVGGIFVYVSKHRRAVTVPAPQEVAQGIILEIKQDEKTVVVQDEQDKRIEITLAPEAKLFDEENIPAQFSYLKWGYAIQAKGIFTKENSLSASEVRVVATSIPVTYTNPYFKITLVYPSSWIPNKRITTLPDVPSGFEGPDGFFSIDAVGGSPALLLNEVAENLAFQKQQPYGKTPNVLSSKADNQEATYILPSSDQPSENKGESVFIARYPHPIVIGKNTYYFFVLYADKIHIRELAGTLKFL